MAAQQRPPASHPPFGADARARVTLAAPATKAAPAAPAFAMARRFASEFDRYWAFFLWVVVIAAGMWPPLLAPLAVVAFPSAAVAGRAAVVLAISVSGFGGGAGGRTRARGRGARARRRRRPPSPLSQATLAALPLGATPPWGRALCRYILTRTQDLMAEFKVVTDDGAVFERGRAYVIGFEPHSTLPMGAVLAFNSVTGTVPPGLEGVRLLASSLVGN